MAISSGEYAWILAGFQLSAYCQAFRVRAISSIPRQPNLGVSSESSLIVSVSVCEGPVTHECPSIQMFGEKMEILG